MIYEDFLKQKVKLAKATGFELNHTYFLDGATYCKAAEEGVKMPTLFDMVND